MSKKELIKEKIEELETNPEIGLLSGMADIRLQRYGKNTLYEISKIPFKLIIIKSLNTIENFFLLAFIIFLIYIKDIQWIIYPVIFILLNTFAVYYETLRVYNLIITHIKSIKFNAKVLRDKKIRQIDAELIVPGDILILEKGDIVPADILILEANYFQTEEGKYRKAGEELLKWDIIKSGWAKVLVLRTGNKCKNNIVKSIDIENNPVFLKIKKLHRIYNLAIIVIFFILFFCLKNQFLSFSFLGATISLKLLFWGKGIFSKFLKMNLDAEIFINNFNCLLKNIPRTIIIDKLDTILKPEYVISKIYVDNRLIEVTDEYNSTEGDFYLRDIKILKEKNWEEKEEELKTQYLLHKQNRKNPNPYRKFKKINPHKIESLKKSILIGKLTSYGEIEKTLAGTAEFSDHPLDFAFHILFEKAKLSFKEYSRLKYDKIESFEIAFVKFHNKNFVFVKAPAEILLKKSLWVLNKGKKVGLTFERENRLQNIINQLSSQSHKVYATAYQELNEKEFDNLKTMDNPVEKLKNLVITALCGIKVELNEGFPKLKENVKELILIVEDNKFLVEYLLKKSRILNENDKIITQEEFSKLSEIDYLNIKDKIKIYAGFTGKDKSSLINYFSKDNTPVLLISDKFIHYHGCIKILDARFSNEKEKINADIIITTDLLSSLNLFYVLNNNFYYKLSLIVFEKFSLNLLRLLFFGLIILTKIISLNIKIIFPLIFSIYFELILALFYKRKIDLNFIYFYGKKHYLDLGIKNTILLDITLLLIFLTHTNLFTILFILFIIDFFFTTEKFITSLLKVIIILFITNFIPFLHFIFNINKITLFPSIVFALYILLLQLKKRFLT